MDFDKSDEWEKLWGEDRIARPAVTKGRSVDARRSVDDGTPDGGSSTLYRTRQRRLRLRLRLRLRYLVALLLVLAVGAGYLVWDHLEHGPLKIPSRYTALLNTAATTCSQETVALLAAQIDAESGWNAEADSGQAQGIAQFTPATWAEWGGDYDHSGGSSVWDPGDAIPAQATYMCSLFRQTASVPGDATANALAAYNAGPSAVIKAGGVPDFSQTTAYVHRIMNDLEPRYLKGLAGT